MPPLSSCSVSSSEASSSSHHVLRRHRRRRTTTCVIINNVDFNLFISPVVFILLLFAIVNPATAAAETSSTLSLSSPTTATIAAGTDYGYKYIGCYNETTAGVSGTGGGGGGGTRALYGGINEVLPGVMTVGKCLGFCKGGMDKKGYRFAGLEYSRECWCASQIFSLSAKVADAECDLPCDGDESQICGGSLRISVYDLQGNVDSVAAVGKSKSIRLVLELALVVGGAVFARLLW
ncbi:WSC domain-containing protein [Neurospora intermedia]|uniref:WSC domain-containing protein n=1 Tax=Neurospora intermedia TaxID=5142 RepID=A0ABR3D195_NEUIN